MKTNVTIYIKAVVPITHGDGAVASFVEKLAEDVISDAIHVADKDVEIKTLNSTSTGCVPG